MQPLPLCCSLLASWPLDAMDSRFIAHLALPALPCLALLLPSSSFDASLPMLQLSAVIDRLLSMPVTVPLKAMLTGVELLLAKAQVKTLHRFSRLFVI